MIKMTAFHISNNNGEWTTDIRFLKQEEGMEDEIISATLKGQQHNDFWDEFNSFASIYEIMGLPVPENVEELIKNN